VSMARLAYPDESSRWTFRPGPAGAAFLSVAGQTARVFLDSAGTTPALDLLDADSLPLTTGVLLVDQNSFLPDFFGPDGVDTLWVSVNGGAVTAVNAREDDRLDALTALILDPNLTAIAALDSAVAGALVTDGAGWIRKTYAQLKTALSLVKADVGLGNVDNTADLAKPVSTAQQAVLDLKLAITDASAAYPARRGGTSAVAASPTAWNVRDFGALGDDSTDDTTAIQAAINAAAGASVLCARVIVPASTGQYVFSNLTVPQGVHLAGDGWSLDNQNAFGSASYATGASKAVGSVLRSTATSGTAINFTGVARSYRLSDLCVIGPGSGTSAGVVLGAGAVTTKHHFSDVMVANFATCWDLNGCEDSLFSQLKARGCHTGFAFHANANQNVILNIEVQFSDTDGLTVDGTANLFLGGLLQNTSGTSSVRQIAGDCNSYQNFYHESASPPSDMIKVTAGTQNAFRDWYISSPTTRITIDGGGGNTFENFRPSSGTQNVVLNAAAGARFVDVDGLTLTGTQTATARILDDATGIKLGSLGQDVRIPTGKKFYFESVGTGNYIYRDAGTGETEVSSGATSVKTPASMCFRTGRAVTGSRPTPANAGNGAMFYDTTLSKPIWSDGTNWRDAAGTIV
jgi:hypothetical protein